MIDKDEAHEAHEPARLIFMPGIGPVRFHARNGPG